MSLHRSRTHAGVELKARRSRGKQGTGHLLDARGMSTKADSQIYCRRTLWIFFSVFSNQSRPSFPSVVGCLSRWFVFIVELTLLEGDRGTVGLGDLALI